MEAAAATVEAAACPGELAAWCGGWRGQLHGAVPDQLAAAVRRLALAALLQDRLAVEDSPTAEDSVKLLDVLPEVAAAAAVRAVLLSVLLSPPCRLCIVAAHSRHAHTWLRVCDVCIIGFCATLQARVRRVKLGLAAGATDAECVAKEEVRSPLLPGPSPSRGVWVGSFGGRDLGVGVGVCVWGGGITPDGREAGGRGGGE